MAELPLDAVRTVFDIAIGSLNFSSGFLDDEEVGALRELAVELGVDPWLATPHTHAPKYCPEHVWSRWTHGVNIGMGVIGSRRRCENCGKAEHRRVKDEPIGESSITVG